MQDPAGEAVDPFEARHVRDREVAGGHDDVVELLLVVRLLVQVRRAHREPARRLGVGDVAHRGAEPDVLAHVGLLGPAEDVAVENRVGRERGNRLSEMLLERVVPELQRLLRPVGPQVPVHAAVHGLAMLVEARAPGVVPQTAPVGLPFEAHQLRNVRALGFRLLEGAKLRKPQGPAPMMATRLFIACSLSQSSALDEPIRWVSKLAQGAGLPPRSPRTDTVHCRCVATGLGHAPADSMPRRRRVLSPRARAIDPGKGAADRARASPIVAAGDGTGHARGAPSAGSCHAGRAKDLRDRGPPGEELFVPPAWNGLGPFCCESTLEGSLLGARASRPHGQSRASGPLRGGTPAPPGKPAPQRGILSCDGVVNPTMSVWTETGALQQFPPAP